MPSVLAISKTDIESDILATTYKDGIKALKEQQWDICFIEPNYENMKILRWLENHKQYLPKEILVSECSDVISIVDYKIKDKIHELYSCNRNPNLFKRILCYFGIIK
jgi:hypothetical protein